MTGIDQVLKWKDEQQSLRLCPDKELSSVDFTSEFEEFRELINQKDANTIDTFYKGLVFLTLVNRRISSLELGEELLERVKQFQHAVSICSSIKGSGPVLSPSLDLHEFYRQLKEAETFLGQRIENLPKAEGCLRLVSKTREEVEGMIAVV